MARLSILSVTYQTSRLRANAPRVGRTPDDSVAIAWQPWRMVRGWLILEGIPMVSCSKRYGIGIAVMALLSAGATLLTSARAAEVTVLSASAMKRDRP
jgi:hypothetical protein